MKKASVLNGIDQIDTLLHELSGKRIGLITNPTGVDKNLRSTVDILIEKTDLCCLFAPEHGIRGDVQAGGKIETYTDQKTGLTVHSLYGGSPHIPEDALKNIDVIAYDIQDVGARFYTYIYTLFYAMQDAASQGKTVLVFDRPNPLSGSRVEGTVLKPEFSSFVGKFPIATRYNLTVGEYAKYINVTQNIGCDLLVVPLSGWNRDMYYDDTDLVFVPPSPNLPTVDSCITYIGTCIVEGTNLSEGRGTAKPFETIGAPWLKAEETVERLNSLGLLGVAFRPCFFTPAFSKYAGRQCSGIQLHITDRKAFYPFETALRMVDIIRSTHDEFGFNPPDRNQSFFFDKLLGTDVFRSKDFNIETFLSDQQKEAQAFEKSIKPYYMY